LNQLSSRPARYLSAVGAVGAGPSGSPNPDTGQLDAESVRMANLVALTKTREAEARLKKPRLPLRSDWRGASSLRTVLPRRRRESSPDRRSCSMKRFGTSKTWTFAPGNRSFDCLTK